MPPAAPAGGAAAPLAKGPLIAGIAGSALALIASLLAWTTVEATSTEMAQVMEGSESVKGTDGDGLFTLFTALIALALFAVAFARRNPKFAAFALIPTVVTLGIAVFNVADPERLARGYLEDQTGGEATAEQLDSYMQNFEFSTAAGMWVLLVGVLAALAGGAMVALKSRSSR